jgi:adenine-specific DNA methylase
MLGFRDLATSRQNLMLGSVARLLREVEKRATLEPVASTLSLVLGRLQDLNNALVRWADTVVGANAGQNRLSMTWDFAEAAPLADAGGSWSGQLDWVLRAIDHVAASVRHSGSVQQAPAQVSPLADDSAHALVTDPPYYDAFAYADLSDLFFVWLKRATSNPAARFGLIGEDGKTPKKEEIVVNPGASSDGRGPKDHDWFYTQMRRAFEESRRVVWPGGIGIVVFAHKDTKSWEALLSGVVDAGWIVTASWPIETERPTRQRAIGSAALSSSVHLVCRPRENPDGSVRMDEVGDWRDVLAELPRRIHDWMPRLAEEGVVGADAIFACLGPALEVFSRYSRVEKASGEAVTLKEYLEHVWAAVSREAISVIFQSADTSGLDPDARLTAMWLWTLVAPASGVGGDETSNGDPEVDDEESDSSSTSKTQGFVLEFDAARKIAQGLGANLAELSHVVEVKGDKARLLSAAERSGYLFGAVPSSEQTSAKKRSKRKQLALFEEVVAEAEQENWGDLGAPRAGATTLDRIHQAMLLFGTGRSEALKRFLVEEGVGRQAPFWKLAQALSALYPVGTDEKRWVDGVLARKKALGFA